MENNLEQTYNQYVNDFISQEIDEEFKNSIDDYDYSIILGYGNHVIGRACDNIAGLSQNPQVLEYFLAEIVLSTKIGYTLNSANKRFSMESEENIISWKKEDNKQIIIHLKKK